MSEPTAFPLDESKLPFKIPKDTKPREKNYEAGADDHRPCARQSCAA